MTVNNTVRAIPIAYCWPLCELFGLGCCVRGNVRGEDDDDVLFEVRSVVMVALKYVVMSVVRFLGDVARFIVTSEGCGE